MSSLRMRQIPPTCETIIAVKGLAHSGRVLWKRDPADWFDMPCRVPSWWTRTRWPSRAAKDVGTAGNGKTGRRLEATFEFAEQMAGFPRFSIEAPAGTIIEVMVQESHDPQKNALARHVSFFVGAVHLPRRHQRIRNVRLRVAALAPASHSQRLTPGGRARCRPATAAIRLAARAGDPHVGAPLQRLFDSSINTLQLRARCRRRWRWPRTPAVQRRRRPPDARDPVRVRRATHWCATCGCSVKA